MLPMEKSVTLTGGCTNEIFNLLQSSAGLVIVAGATAQMANKHTLTQFVWERELFTILT
jgi:hypothetical protein